MYTGLYISYSSVYNNPMDATATSRQVTHYDSSVGLDQRTACGKSLHGWAIGRPQNVTTVKHEVTCKRCLSKLAA